MTDGIHTVLIVNDEAAHWQGYRDRLARESGAESVSIAVPPGDRRDSIVATLGNKLRTVTDDPYDLLAREKPQLAVFFTRRTDINSPRGIINDDRQTVFLLPVVNLIQSEKTQQMRTYL